MVSAAPRTDTYLQRRPKTGGRSEGLKDLFLCDALRALKFLQVPWYIVHI